ncbi:MAG: hypothetical protein K8S56_07960 [Candidatus Cloacimonetes bacterium]|nr:hypothetical protein [Candidatus Cloacimonadota bacterium]
MKYISRIRFFIILFLLIALTHGLIIYVTLQNANLNEQTRTDLNNILIFMGILEFAFAMIFFFYFPVFIRRGLSSVKSLLDEVSRGNYNIEIVDEVYSKRDEKQICELVQLFAKMMFAVNRFDKAKREKIVEYKSRLDNLMRMTENGFIVVTLDGTIRFLSHSLTNVFRNLSKSKTSSTVIIRLI